MPEFAYQSANEPLDPELQARYKLFFDRLDEQQKRWFAALESERHGWGGVRAICKVYQLSPTTVLRGRQELDSGLVDRPQDRLRKPGGGRRKAEKKIPPSAKP